jgi:hypothetical protein
MRCTSGTITIPLNTGIPDLTKSLAYFGDMRVRGGALRARSLAFVRTSRNRVNILCKQTCTFLPQRRRGLACQHRIGRICSGAIFVVTPPFT